MHDLARLRSDSWSASESPRSISSSGRKARPSTVGSSGSPAAPDSNTSPSRSANPAAGALSSSSTSSSTSSTSPRHAYVRPPPRIRTQTGTPPPPRTTPEAPATAATTTATATTSRTTESPSGDQSLIMSSTLTLTSPATATTTASATTESGSRVASWDAPYRYAETQHFPERMIESLPPPVWRHALIVNATAAACNSTSNANTNATTNVNTNVTRNASPSGSGLGTGSHDQHAYSYSQSSYPQIVYTTNDSQQQQQVFRAGGGTSSSSRTWSETISEIPTAITSAASSARARGSTSAGASAAARARARAASTEPNLSSRSPVAAYGSGSPSASVLLSGYIPGRSGSSSVQHGHVRQYPASSSSGVLQDPAVPPSLASYTLTSPAAQASALSRDQEDLYGSSSSTATTTATVWPSMSDAYGGFDANKPSVDQWLPQLHSSPIEATAPSFSGQQSYSLQGSSPTQANSPGSMPEAGPSTTTSWTRVAPAGTVDAGEASQLQSARQYGHNLSSTNSSTRPSLTQSVLTPSSSSSSVQLPTLGTASGAGPSPVAPPTSARTSTAAASRIPEFMSPYSHPPFASLSPVSPARQAGNVIQASTTLSRLVTSQVRTALIEANIGPASSASAPVEAHYETYQSPQYDSEMHSPTSSRLGHSYASPEHGQRQYELPAAPQVPILHSRHAVQTLMGSTGHTRDSPSSSSGATLPAPPSGSRGASHVYAATNSGAYSGLYGGGPATDSDPSSSALLARSSSAALLHAVPVTISSAQRYSYPYISSYSPVPGTPSAPLPVPATSAASTSGTGSSANQSTRKRNHPCWMCHKSFDRPSTLRKHFLVHTGEKAYVCDICGRRFGVASNLNRHTRRCIARPVNSTSFHRASASAATSVAGPSTSASALTSSQTSGTMAREQTNPDVRRIERERDGREVRDEEQTLLVPVHVDPPTAAAAAQQQQTTSPSRPPHSRRRGRSPVQSPLGEQHTNTSVTPESQGSSSGQMSYQLRPAFESGAGHASGSGSGQVAVATASSSASTGEALERRPKRRRRAPSPSNWVPESLRNFSLSPVRQRTSTPLPPVSPGYNEATGAWEERDSYATVTDENVDPSTGEGSGNNSASAVVGGRTREERLRNFEYAPYHPCGWTGRLPGPAVVGNDVTNYTKSVIGGGRSGSGPGGRYSGGNTGGALSFMFEFSLAAAG